MEILLIILHTVLILATLGLIDTFNEHHEWKKTEPETISGISHAVFKLGQTLMYLYVALNGITISHWVWAFMTKVGIV